MSKITLHCPACHQMAVYDFRFYYADGRQTCGRCETDTVPGCDCDEEAECGCLCATNDDECKHILKGPTMEPTHIEGSNILAEVVELPEGNDCDYPFSRGDTVMILGEIQNMRMHYAVAAHDGRVYFGFHLELFKILVSDET